MCTGLEIAALAAAAAGTGLTAYNQDQTLKKQDKAAAEGIRRQAEIQRQASEDVRGNIDQLRQSNAKDETATNEQAFMNAVKQRQAQAGSNTLATPDFGSAAYSQGTANARAANKKDIGGLIKTAAAIDAPVQQRQSEGNASADTASRLSLLGGQSDSAQYLNSLKMRSIRANPWVNALGEGLTSFGGAMASKAGYDAAGSAGVTPGLTAEQNGWLKNWKAAVPVSGVYGG